LPDVIWCAANMPRPGCADKTLTGYLRRSGCRRGPTRWGFGKRWAPLPLDRASASDDASCFRAILAAR
jgi:hypothetical protein